MSGTLWQIVPRQPGSRDGVGDYAQILASRLQESCGYETIFLTGADLTSPPNESPLAILLHFVNYGYQARGIPMQLAARLAELQRRIGVRVITIFHELYATGTWRQSAFWLRPWQQSISRKIAELSAVCLVSSPTAASQLRRLSPSVRILVRPVFSTFGEPELIPSQIAARNCGCWIICGGNELVERSLRSFLAKTALPAKELYVVGGQDRESIRELLSTGRNLTTHYLPEVTSATASAALSSCAFGWLDYFAQADVPAEAILKSTAFAAYCAHGVIPVQPMIAGKISLGEDQLPGPFSFDHLPNESDRAEIAAIIYRWYERQASSHLLARTIADEIQA